MTNQIVQAFAKAGIKMTKSERIWLYLKDKPAQSAADIQHALKMKNISGTLHYMDKAGLLTAGRVNLNNRGFKNLYSAKGQVYDGSGMYAGRASDQSLKAEAQKVVGVPTETPAGKDPYDIENLTVGEARALYSKLKKMFA